MYEYLRSTEEPQHQASETSILTEKRVFFIVNPTAGNGLSTTERHQIENAGVMIQANGNTVEIEETTAPDHAIEIAQNAKNSGFSVIIGVGGDGTLNEIVQSTAQSNVIIGTIPTGFFSLWAKEMRVPGCIQKASESLLSSQVKEVDIGRVNDKLLLQFANLGFDSEQYMKLHKPGTERNMSGRKLFYRVGALCFRDIWKYSGHDVQIQINGETVETNILVGVLSNATKYGPLNVHRDTVVNDGNMETTFFTGENGPKLFLQFPMVLLHQDRHVGVLRDRFDAITIESKADDKIGITVDGNPVGYSEVVTAEVFPKAQKVLVPQNVPATIFEE